MLTCWDNDPDRQTDRHVRSPCGLWLMYIFMFDVRYPYYCEHMCCCCIDNNWINEIKDFQRCHQAYWVDSGWHHQ